MDHYPADQFQKPSPMIKLKSSDGEVFEVEVKVANMSLTIKEMLDDLGLDGLEFIAIPENAPEISGTILAKIIQWANHHKDDPATADDDEKKVKPMDDFSTWDADFLTVDQTTLFQMIRAADYLNIKGLLDVTCKKVANMINRKTAEEVRQKFNIPKDFSADEEEQVFSDKFWCRPIGSDNDSDDDNCNVGDGTPADSFENTDHQDDQVLEDCFRNPIVVRKVLEHFPSWELLERFQFVNKLWNHEARIVMKKLGNIVAYLVLGCQNESRLYSRAVGPFREHLRRLNVVPYAGVSLVISNEVDDGSTPLDVDATCGAILDRLPLKHLSVTVNCSWWDHQNCPGFVLLKKLLQDSGGVIEELNLIISGPRIEFIHDFLRDCSFPSLRVLKLEDWGDIEDYTSYVQSLVSRARRLQVLHTPRPIYLANVLEGREAVLMYAPKACAPFDEISEAGINSLRLETLEMKYPTEGQLDFERFNRVAPLLLQTSCTELCSINIDAVLAVSLMCFGICVENVKNLGFDINFNQLAREQPRFLRIVKNFGFSRLFPKVKKVQISPAFYFHLSADHLNALIDQADAVLEEPALDRADNVKELDLRLWNEPNAAAVSFFAELLPSIQKLKVEAAEPEVELPFGSIWKHWVDLEQFEAHADILQNSQNLDSVFCGIFPKEVAELRQKDEEFLKRVNIVPVMPAITSLKNLRTVTLNYTGRRFETFVDDGNFMFSKVTALIAFARCPTLTVNLNIASFGAPPAMNYLKPYVSIESTLLEMIEEW